MERLQALVHCLRELVFHDLRAGAIERAIADDLRPGADDRPELRSTGSRTGYLDGVTAIA